MEKLVLKSRWKFVAAGLLVLLTGCGGALEDKKDPEGIDEYAVVNGSFGQKDQQTVNGTGILRFLTTASAVHSHRTFSVHATFPSANSAVTVIAFASTQSLTDGVQVRFLRNGNAINVAVAVAGWGGVNVKPAVTAKLATTNADFVVEVANDVGSPQVFVWSGDTDEPNAGNALVDTMVPSQLDGTMPAGNGTGIYLGLRVDNATVTRARVRQNYAP